MGIRGTQTKQVASAYEGDIYIDGAFLGTCKGLELVQVQETERDYTDNSYKPGPVKNVGPSRMIVRLKGVTVQNNSAALELMNRANHFNIINEAPPWADKSEWPTSINDKIATPKEPIMKATHLIALLAQGYTTVRVGFANSGRFYTYKAKRGIRSGVPVVVETPDGLKVGTVLAVDDNPKIDVTAEYDYKWIVSVVGTSAYEATMQREAKFLQALEEVEQAKAREQQLKAYRESLPEGSEARNLFENALAELTQTPALPSAQQELPMAGDDVMPA